MRKALHDLNNQLAVILNFTTFVLEDMAPDDPRRKDLLEVLRAAESSRDIAHELLTGSPPD